MKLCVLLLPAQGNAPYLLGVRIARDCDFDIVIPDFYGKNQREILISEFPDYLSRIFISVRLGEILKPALRDASGPPSIDAYAESVLIGQEILDQNISEFLSREIEAEALDGTKRKFGGFAAALNCGLPVFSHIVPTFYMFTGKMSDIYFFSEYQSQGIIKLSNFWSKLEKTFHKMFVPKLNALSYLNYDVTGLWLTPALTRPYPLDNFPLPHKSLLIIPSGTRLNLENLVSISQSSSIPVVTLPNAPAELNIPRYETSIWGNPNIIGVIARAGWGTIWQCLLNCKPIGTMLVNMNEDPEIAHSIKTIEWSGIGILLNDSIEPLAKNLNLYINNIEHIFKNNTKEFGTNDGVRYISKIIQSELKSI